MPTYYQNQLTASVDNKNSYHHGRVGYMPRSITVMFMGILVGVCTGCSLPGSSILGWVGAGLRAMTHAAGPAYAKDEVYVTGKEILRATSNVIDHIYLVYFKYESGWHGNNAGPPFRAHLDIRFILHTRYCNKYITDTLHNILLKIPGWSTDIKKYNSHSSVIKKDNMTIYLPRYYNSTESGIEIDGPLIVDEDLRKVPDHWDDNGAHGPLHAEDVTKDFRPAKKIISRHKNFLTRY